MPWEKSFNRDEALDGAMSVFWQKGYERTSYADLVTAAGASRYGLYSEFGEKHNMYLAALDRYRDVPVTGLLGKLAHKDAGLAELKDYFERLVRAFRSKDARNGCLMSLSAIDLAPHDPEVKTRVLANFKRIRGIYQRALENAQVANEWPSSQDAAVTASALFGIVQGAAVFQRGGMTLKEVADYVENSVNLLI